MDRRATLPVLAIVLLSLTGCGKFGYRVVDAVIATDGSAIDAGFASPDGESGAIAVEDTSADLAFDLLAPPVDEAPAADSPLEPAAASGLVGYWKLDEGQGTAAMDSSVYRNHGSLRNGPTWAKGAIGTALSFTDQNPNHVRIASSSTVNGINRGITIAAWVYTLGSGWQQTLLSRQIAGSVDQHYTFSIFESMLQFGGRGAKLTQVLRPFPDKQWVHLAATYDGTTARLYVNGALVGSGPVAVTLGPDTTPVLIGAEQDGPNLWSSMNGLLDEVRLYDRVLGPVELVALAR